MSAEGADRLGALRAFLDEKVEGDLFDDLDRLVRALPRSGEIGVAGYPLIAASVEIIDLLGALVSSAPFDPTDPRQSSRHFKSYWYGYLSLYDEVYSAPSLASQFRRVVRSGIKRDHVAMPGLRLWKGPAAPHMIVDSTSHALHVDCARLASDVKQSYLRSVKPVTFERFIGGRTTRATMERNLADLLRHQQTSPGRALPTRLSATSYVSPNISA